MAAAAPAASLAATGLSAGSKIMQGNTQSSNMRTEAVNDVLQAGALRIQGQNDLLQGQMTKSFDDFKASNLDIDATAGELKASETDVFMRDRLMGALSNITAVRASAGVAGDSPTGFAIMNRAEALGDTERQTRLDNIRQQIASDRSGAALERAAGLSALSQGQINQKLKESGASQAEANAAQAESNASAAKTSGMLSGFATLLQGISGMSGLKSGGGGGGGGDDALGPGTSGL